MFFAEGTFTRVSGLTEFRMGAFVVAAQTGLAVVPIALRGARAILRPEHWLLRRGRVSITLCPPVQPAGLDWNAALRLRELARAAILPHCGEPDLLPPPD